MPRFLIVPVAASRNGTVAPRCSVLLFLVALTDHVTFPSHFLSFKKASRSFEVFSFFPGSASRTLTDRRGFFGDFSGSPAAPESRCCGNDESASLLEARFLRSDGGGGGGDGGESVSSLRVLSLQGTVHPAAASESFTYGSRPGQSDGFIVGASCGGVERGSAAIMTPLSSSCGFRDAHCFLFSLALAAAASTISLCEDRTRPASASGGGSWE